VSQETVIRQRRPRLEGEKFDPQESNPRFRSVFARADAAAERRVGNIPRDKKFIFYFWSVKKEILERTYGINWKTPAELNPSILYDSYGQPQLTAREIRRITPIVQKHLHHIGEKITSFERTFDGDVYVWTRVGNAEARGQYVVTAAGQSWKITAYHLVLP